MTKKTKTFKYTNLKGLSKWLKYHWTDKQLSRKCLFLTGVLFDISVTGYTIYLIYTFHNFFSYGLGIALLSYYIQRSVNFMTNKVKEIISHWQRRE